MVNTDFAIYSILSLRKIVANYKSQSFNVESSTNHLLALCTYHTLTCQSPALVDKSREIYK